MITRSLHTQVVLVLALLTMTLLGQLLLSRDNLITLSENQKSITDSYDDVGLVYELERDVIDIQRNLLIYKETGSDTSIMRFYTIMERVEAKLSRFQELSSSGHNVGVDEKLVARMAEHLTDYQDNFSSVINGRSKQEEILVEIQSLLDAIDSESDKILSKNAPQLSEIHLLVSKMGLSFYGYLYSLDSDVSTRFKEQGKELKKVIFSIKGQTGQLKKSVNLLNKRFIRLTHAANGYVYLVNVVMAGSASEFLYLSEKIRKDVKISKNEIIIKTNESSKKIKFDNNVIATVSIIIVLLIAWFLSIRILGPIKGITNVFRVLSRGGEVEKIPSTQRKDEVGDLAKAAAVFHDKNKQTQDLLEKSQDMIAIQEVMNIQLEEEKNKAQEAAKSKSMFLANMSHEIRTPMNGIVGLVDLMIQTNLTDKQKNYLDRIAYSGQIMMNVINDILDFSKIEAGKMEIEKVEFDINTVIENLISAMDTRIREKDLDFIVNVAPNVPNKLLGDPLRISQVLLNLCSNSIKFTHEGHVKVDIHYQEGAIHFTVSDTGIGLSKAQLDTIFQSFTQADGSTSRKYGGTGLGLSIVKQLVNLMGGEVRLESIENIGTQAFLDIKAEQSLSTMALTQLSVNDNRIMYLLDSALVDSSQATYDSGVLTLLGLDVVSITPDDNQPVDFTQYAAPSLIQSSDIEFIKQHESSISQAIKSEVNIGFIIQTNAYKLKDYIYEKWRLPVLIHPFSPQQQQNYLLALFDQNNKANSEEAELQEDQLYNGHVLLVEDNMINQLVAGDMIESLGLTYDVADEGLSAVELIESGKHYEMVFMDVQMPIMDGYTATIKLRELGYKDLIICGLSANALPEDLAKAEEVGMNDYLTKPIQITEMEAAVKKYVSKK